MRKPFKMIPNNRASRFLLTALRYLLTPFVLGGLFLLIHANPLAQSTQLPAPKTHINDVANVIEAQARTRLEGVLERLKEKSKIELYIAVVDNTDGIQI